MLRVEEWCDEQNRQELAARERIAREFPDEWRQFNEAFKKRHNYDPDTEDWSAHCTLCMMGWIKPLGNETPPKPKPELLIYQAESEI